MPGAVGRFLSLQGCANILSQDHVTPVRIRGLGLYAFHAPGPIAVVLNVLSDRRRSAGQTFGDFVYDDLYAAGDAGCRTITSQTLAIVIQQEDREGNGIDAQDLIRKGG